jgi:hypothetical protein
VPRLLLGGMVLSPTLPAILMGRPWAGAFPDSFDPATSAPASAVEPTEPGSVPIGDGDGGFLPCEAVQAACSDVCNVVRLMKLWLFLGAVNQSAPQEAVFILCRVQRHVRSMSCSSRHLPGGIRHGLMRSQNPNRASAL